MWPFSKKHRTPETIEKKYSTLFTGEKFYRGMHAELYEDLVQHDYYEQRKISSNLFSKNIYAASLIRRLITSEIVDGVYPESTPSGMLLGFGDDYISEWSEMSEIKFLAWAKTPSAVHVRKSLDLAAIQRLVRLESILGGDVLLVISQNKFNLMPQISIYDGASIATPYDAALKSTIIDGVEFTKDGQEVAYHVKQKNDSFIRVPRFDLQGRPVAILVCGMERRANQVRGIPALTLFSQSLVDLDGYRDAAARKARVNSQLAMFIKSGSGGISDPMASALIKNNVIEGEGETKKRLKLSSALIPGSIIHWLNPGEEPVLKGGDGVDINFGGFEDPILNAMAAALEIPPEIARLMFNKNYSASQAANNEFFQYVQKRWAIMGADYLNAIRNEFILSSVITDKINAPGYLDAFVSGDYEKLFGWNDCSWYGQIKLSVNPVDRVDAAAKAIEQGLSTREQEARKLFGNSWSTNIKKLAKENALLASVNKPLSDQRNNVNQGDQQTSGDFNE